MEVSTYIDDLFRYIETFENQTAQFQTEAFVQTYSGIVAVFSTLRQQRQDAIAVDQYFLEKIKAAPLTSSDLRQLTIQVLITYFESEADTDGQSNQAYAYCRGLRAVKQDIPFFENHLIPRLFQQGGCGNNHQLANFLLTEIARYVNKFGRPLDPNLSPERFQGMNDATKMLELMRRRLQLGETLLSERTSLEFHLQRIDEFNKLSPRHPLNDYLIKKWGYVKTTSFWSRVGAALSSAWSQITGTFSSFAYTRLAINQRKPAYLFYGLIIVICLFLAVYLPFSWHNYGKDKLDTLNERTKTTVSSDKR